MALAVQKFCQYSKACGNGPTRFARYDAGSVASHKGELTAAFREACAHWKIQLIASAPEDLQTNPVERSYQLACHIMCTLFLSQVNLNTICLGGETKTPCELFTGILSDLLHITAFPIGTFALCPRVVKKQVLGSMNELLVVI